MRTALVAGLVALGATEGTDARAQAPQGPATATTPPTVPPPPPRVRKGAAGHSKSVGRNGLIATLPGFELLPDGGSRLFVELNKTATVAEKREGRTLSYVIQGARVDLRNNENALVTVHFNTPVSRARLLPVKGNLVFSVELRADSPSTWRMVDSPDGAATVLQVDFPRGAFLSLGEYDPAVGAAPAPGTVAVQPPQAQQPQGAPMPATLPASPPGPQPQ